MPKAKASATPDTYALNTGADLQKAIARVNAKVQSEDLSAEDAQDIITEMRNTRKAPAEFAPEVAEKTEAAKPASTGDSNPPAE